MADTFEASQPGRGPTFLLGRWGRAWGASFGAAKDRLVDAAKDAVRVGLVYLAPVDALPLLLADAALEGLPGETSDQQRARVAASFDVWELAGLLGGLSLALDQLGLTGTFRRWPEYAPGLPPGGDASKWATWLCTITTHPWTDDGAWDDPGTWDDGGTWDSTATVADVARMRRLFRAQMGASHRGFLRLVFTAGVDFWGPDTPWDHGTWTDDSTPTHIDIEV